ncbi:dihydrofolate reductase family protein [Planococcus sp. YIM B11945]|uniref:dihydrofolate reductase family protein n=1 Tax=Planococcus sp. YIM B11945 TaxID=3435410 RepID=UPI003D7D1039
MRKIKMLNRVSLDGYFASLNEAANGMDWFVQDPEVDLAVRAHDSRADTLLLGAETFRLFEKSWVPIKNDPNAPEQLIAIAEELTEMTKITFSTKLRKSDWENSLFYDGDLLNVVKNLKKEEGSDILILGSGSIVQQLADHRLIDEYFFIVTPVVAGTGKQLFKDTQQFGLTLLNIQAFSSGNVLLHYGLKE